ncbi:hypothetical protein BCR34DRAFT_558360 [Clohesyomyces aquaticus]|uniref:Uncharacterized protein n=1 Tax=Clohesyomyces aquaticus TaxID=1231657 RepID=A0A1Y1ZZL9_9PLEO|nr:hypothetical protein BCR34DRAFT_558360 [Clohesyomyces aquaticus]
MGGPCTSNLSPRRTTPIVNCISKKESMLSGWRPRNGGHYVDPRKLPMTADLSLIDDCWGAILVFCHARRGKRLAFAPSLSLSFHEPRRFHLLSYPLTWCNYLKLRVNYSVTSHSDRDSFVLFYSSRTHIATVSTDEATSCTRPCATQFQKRLLLTISCKGTSVLQGWLFDSE